MNCLPDTGCTQTILAKTTADLLRLNVSDNSGVQLFTANGGSVSVCGMARVRIQNQNNEIVSTAIVAENMSHPALISWHDLMSLKIISPQFPEIAA